MLPPAVPYQRPVEPFEPVAYKRDLPNDDTGRFVVRRELMDDLADPDDD
jgi:hypothetical protein